MAFTFKKYSQFIYAVLSTKEFLKVIVDITVKLPFYGHPPWCDSLEK